MQVRCGTDIIHIDRFSRAIERQGERFLARIFTLQEQSACEGRTASLAARFAAKEAIAKALGTGIGPLGIRWTDLEVQTDSAGAPHVVLHEAAERRYQDLSGQSIAISLSHDQNLAQAFCVLICQAK